MGQYRCKELFPSFNIITRCYIILFDMQHFWPICVLICTILLVLSEITNKTHIPLPSLLLMDEQQFNWLLLKKIVKQIVYDDFRGHTETRLES